MQEQFELHEHSDYLILKLNLTKFDLFEIPEISKSIEKKIRDLNQPALIIDMNNINHIDSTGFGFLISTRNNILKQDKELVVLCNNDSILHVIEILNMNRVLKVFNSLQDAEKYLSTALS